MAVTAQEGISHLGTEPRPMDPQPWLLPGSGAGFSTAHPGDSCTWAVALFPSSDPVTWHHSVSHEALWEICKTLWGNCCLCIPHCLLFIPLPSSWSLLHPPAWPLCTALSALTCTSDTPVPRLISPKSGSSAVLASAWHLQAPDSLSPKDILKDTEFLTRVSSSCLEKDVAQNYSNITFSYFWCNYWTNIRM